MNTYTNTQLRIALAKMLPEKVTFDPDCDELFWDKQSNTVVRNTELLHLCWLAEETLDQEEQIIYIVNLDEMFTSWVATHATWQQRVQALCKVKGIVIS